MYKSIPFCSAQVHDTLTFRYFDGYIFVDLYNTLMIGRVQYAILLYNAHAHNGLPWGGHVTEVWRAPAYKSKIASSIECSRLEVSIMYQWLAATSNELTGIQNSLSKQKLSSLLDSWPRC